MTLLTTFGNVFLRNKKKFPLKTFRVFETNFPETKKCLELFCFENGVASSPTFTKNAKICEQSGLAQPDKSAFESGIYKKIGGLHHQHLHPN